MSQIFAMSRQLATVRSLFGLADKALPELEPSGSIYPGNVAAALFADKAGERWLVPMSWATPDLGRRDDDRVDAVTSVVELLRGESADETRDDQPCLIPATAFFVMRNGRSPGGAWFRPKGAEVFAMAGLWHESVGSQVFTLIVSEKKFERADPFPLCIDPEDYEAWLTGDRPTRRALLEAPQDEAAFELCQTSGTAYEF